MNLASKNLKNVLRPLRVYRINMDCNVIARNSSLVYEGKAVDIRQVGRELGVRYVLQGGVRKPAIGCASRRS